MIVIMKKDANPDQIKKVQDIFRHRDIETVVYQNQETPIIQVHSENQFVPVEQIEQLPAVDRLITKTEESLLVSRQFRPQGTVVRVGDLEIGNTAPVMIAGPCAVENEQQILEAAELVREQGIRLMRGGAFKPRTSPYSFRGLGQRGLELLAKARQKTGVRVVTEVLDAADVPLVAHFADVLQIGSRNMQNYKLLKAAGRSRKPILLKRGMSATLTEFLMSAEYIMAEGNDQIILCERGIRTFVDYSRNTLDLNVVPVIKQRSHLPIIVDPSHGTGRRELILPMSLAALAAGADGVMVEVHPHPEQALSDAEQALTPELFKQLVQKINNFIQWQQQYEQTPPLY